MNVKFMRKTGIIDYDILKTATDNGFYNEKRKGY